jgi:transcriptional regulator with XRE-family HTH domain
MEQQSHSLRQARHRHGWSQEQAIVRIEAIARSMGIAMPTRSSLRTLLSMFENGHRQVPEQYWPILRELYRAADEELGLTRTAREPNDLPMLYIPPPREPYAPTHDVLTYLLNILNEHIRADALTGPRYLFPFIYPQLSLIDQICQSAREPERRPTLFIGAKFAEFCGWVCQDSGDTDSAIYWTNQALDYAHELGDPQLLAYTLHNGSVRVGVRPRPARRQQQPAASRRRRLPHRHLAQLRPPRCPRGRRPAIADTAATTTSPAPAGITGSGPAWASGTVKNTRTRSASRQNRRSPASHASELGVAVPDEEPEGADPVGEVHDQVAGLLGGPGAVGVGGYPEDVHPPGGYLHDEQHIQAPEEDRSAQSGLGRVTWRRSTITS